MAKSQALIEFKDALKLAKSLADLDRDHYHNPPHVTEQHAVQALRGGAIVLMVAAFERYLREMLVEQLDILFHQQPALQLIHLPEKMCIHLIYSNLEWAMNGKPYEPSKQKRDRLRDIDKVCRHIVSENFNAEVFSDTGGNPNATSIREMYKRIGVVGDVFVSIRQNFDGKWGRIESARFLEDKLNEIVGKRHLVAHTADALNISRSDLRSWLRFLTVFSEVLDEETAKIVKGIIRSARANP